MIEIIIGLGLVSIGLAVVAYSERLKKKKALKEVDELHETIKVINSTKPAVATRPRSKKKANAAA